MNWIVTCRLLLCILLIELQIDQQGHEGNYSMIHLVAVEFSSFSDAIEELFTSIRSK